MRIMPPDPLPAWQGRSLVAGHNSKVFHATPFFTPPHSTSLQRQTNLAGVRPPQVGEAPHDVGHVKHPLALAHDRSIGKHVVRHSHLPKRGGDCGEGGGGGDVLPLVAWRQTRKERMPPFCLHSFHAASNCRQQNAKRSPWGPWEPTGKDEVFPSAPLACTFGAKGGRGVEAMVQNMR